VHRVICFDGEALRRAAGVDLELSDLMTLADLAAIYSERDLFDQHARRAFIEAVWETWRDCRRRRPRRKRDERRRSYRRPAYGGTNRHCLRLLLELFNAIGEKPPSVATLRHDLPLVKTGRERSH